MVNYKLAKIYKIICNTSGLTYVGSTCEHTLSRRLSGHTRDYKCYLNGNPNYVTSFEVIKNNNYDIILVEDYPCERKDQLHARERYWIESIHCVNKKTPGRTKKEYREVNKQHFKKYKHEWYEENKERLNEKNNQKDSCICGLIYNHSNKSRHEKTKKHQNFIQEQNPATTD